MILERLKDFYRRSRELKAIELLQRPESYPGLAPWRDQDTRVSFVRLPSFQPYSVWTLQLRDELCQVRRIEWDHVADRHAADVFPELAPTTFGADTLLPLGSVRELLDELSAISLPPFLSVPTLGIDGVSFSIVFGDAWRSACLSWWCKPPGEWQPLVHCYEHAIALFERYLPVSTARNSQLQTGA